MRFSTLLLAAACAAPLVTAQTIQQPGQVYVANQGGFGANTASLTLAPGGTLFAGQFGSTIQSTTIIGDRLYVMSDEAGRIDVVDVGTDARVAQIASADVNSTRYMAEVAPGKAYVTQLYLPDGSFSGGSVAVVDLETNTFTEVINDDSFSNPEGIAVVGGSAFVANAGFGGGTTLTVLDVETDAVTGVVELGCSARAVLSDLNDGEVYAFCGAEIVVVTASTGAVATRIAVPASIQPLGTSLGQDAARLMPRREVGASGAFSAPNMAAAGTGGVLLLNTSLDQVQVYPIDDTRPIGAVGFTSSLNVSLDAIETRSVYVGFADPDNSFTANGEVVRYSVGEEELEVIERFPAGFYPTSVSVSTVLETAADPVAEADRFALTGVFPNPTAHVATAAFTLDRPATVQVQVVDVLGREVLSDERAFAAGDQQVGLDAAALPAGLYVLRLAADGRAATTRFTVAR